MINDLMLPTSDPDPAALNKGDFPVAEPGRGPEALAVQRAAVAVLDEVPGAVHQLGDDEEAELMTVLLRLHGRSAQVATLVTSEAVERGVLPKSDAATTTQWVAGRLADGVPVEPKAIRAMASVADACRERKNTVITQALRDGSCSVESARTALSQADKVAPVIPTADRDEVLGWYLQVDPSLGSAGLTQLTRRIIARFAPDELSKNDEKLERTETLTWSTTPTGMTRLVAELAPVNATILKDAIMAGSAPRPAKSTADADGSTCGAAHADQRSHVSPEADERSPGKRRVDALLELVAAGARAAGGGGTQSAAATVLLTMGLQELLAGQGATTVTGDTVDAGAARRFACTADLVPAVLGGPSAPLDVGRRERLATKAIRAAVTLRDGGCTVPAATDHPASAKSIMFDPGGPAAKPP